MDFVLTEIWDLVHDHKRDAAAKVHNFMHHEGHDAGGEDIVLHVRVPCSPSPFEDIKVDIVLRNVVEVIAVGYGGGEGGIPIEFVC